MATRIAARAWSKGSARNAGPAHAAGSVAVREDSAIDWTRIYLCKCGQTQRRCDDCCAWVCAAPGHARHVCEVRHG